MFLLRQTQRPFHSLSASSSSSKCIFFSAIYSYFSLAGRERFALPLTSDGQRKTLGVIDGWPSLGFINVPLPIGPIPITKLTTDESTNGYYNNANDSTPYVDTASTAAMCAAWYKIVALANNFPNAIYGVVTSNSNSLTTFLWGEAGGPAIGHLRCRARRRFQHARLAGTDQSSGFHSPMAPISHQWRAMTLGAAVFVSLALAASCWSQPPLRDRLLIAMETEQLSLIEIGMFGKMRTLSFTNPIFKTLKLSDRSYVMGVSSTGDRLLIGAQSHTNGYQPEMNDEVDITHADGAILAKIQPQIRGMLSFCAELSPDGRSIAFGGQFARFDARGVYGLHLLTLSGKIRTLVETTEARTPLSVGWSKDNRLIVYDLEGQVLLYNLATDRAAALTKGSRPTWSPDGLWIAYRRPEGSAGLIRPDGTDSKLILANVRLGWGLRWSPDSRYLLYTDATAGGIRALEIESGATTMIFRPTDPQYTETRLRWVRGMSP
jgi:hypothetical protein